jgi:hypothetical protein
MLSDLTDAYSDDRTRPCPTLAVSGRPNRESGRVTPISRRRITNVLPIGAIRYDTRGWPCGRTPNLACSASLPRVIAEGVGS